MGTLSRIGKKIRSLGKGGQDRFVASSVPGEARWFAMLDRSSLCPLLERSTPLSVFFNRHKCASRYVTRVLTEYCEPQGIELKPRVTWGYDILETDWALRHLSPRTRVITAGPGSNQVRDLLVRSGADFNGFHVFRDPRDMIVSGYFSHLNSHPVRWIHQKHHFQRLQGLPIEKGLRLEIDYLGWLELDALRDWDLSDQRIHDVKFEDLTAKPAEQFETIFSFLGLPVERPRLDTILEAVNFEKLSEGRSVGQEDRTSHYRSGRPGDWQNYLTGDLYQYFLDRYGDVTEKLGYPTGTAVHTKRAGEGSL